jgi:ferredoxin
MAASLRPGIAIVAVPSWQASIPPWFELAAAEQARAIPCFTYDPEAGANWAERFDLGGNPQPDRPWPVHTVSHADEQGQAATLEQAFTFAHAVALDPAFRNHFRIVPEEAWSAEQMELSDYLDAPVAVVARKIPFIWVVTENRLARALVTRELAYVSRDRVRAWHILQELAGTDNEYVRKAADAARISTQENAEVREQGLEAGHAEEVDRVRGEAVRAAMERLARSLVGLDPAPTSTPAASVEQETTKPNVEIEPLEETVPPQDEAGNGETSTVIEDPYIDSMLCTSCADCININPRLFKYDANKQAFIDDPTAGTFVQLVKAAEKCPARCIHPGQPAAGDTTANETWVARAAKFN